MGFFLMFPSFFLIKQMAQLGLNPPFKSLETYLLVLFYLSRIVSFFAPFLSRMWCTTERIADVS